LNHQNPQKLVDDYAGTGIRSGNNIPGSSGYQEIVDFKECIGYSIDRETGQKISTSWGKIHYSDKGVHIVPTRPRN
jgi:filamentous hemagglutinin